MQVAFIYSIQGLRTTDMQALIDARTNSKTQVIILTGAVCHLLRGFAEGRRDHVRTTPHIKVDPTGACKSGFTSTHKWRRLIAVACIGLKACRGQKISQGQLVDKMRGVASLERDSAATGQIIKPFQLYDLLWYLLLGFS